jgi:hypothetical protein
VQALAAAVPEGLQGSQCEPRCCFDNPQEVASCGRPARLRGESNGRNGAGMESMSDRTFLILLVLASALALAVGVWIGLGYPGRYDRHEDTGAKAPRRAPVRILLDRFGGSRRRGRNRNAGTGRWSRL